MTAKPFLVIIDTTESTTRQTVGKGILNIHVIVAEDRMIAKQTFLRVFSPFVRSQIQNSVYVYDLEQMTAELNNLSANTLRLFSFIPLAGGRPPHQSDAPVVSLGNKTMASSINPETESKAPVAHPVAPPMTTRPNPARVSSSPRSREFQNSDEGRPTTSNKLNESQRDLVRRMGVTPTPNGYDEGTSLRVNSSIGRNVSLRNIEEQAITSERLTKDQQDLLRKLGDSHTGPQIVEDTDVDPSAAALIDTSLAQIDDAVLSDEEIAKLNDEVKGA